MVMTAAPPKRSYASAKGNKHKARKKDGNKKSVQRIRMQRKAANSLLDRNMIINLLTREETIHCCTFSEHGCLLHPFIDPATGKPSYDDAANSFIEERKRVINKTKHEKKTLRR